MCRCCSRDLGVNVQFWNIWEPRRKTANQKYGNQSVVQLSGKSTRGDLFPQIKLSLSIYLDLMRWIFCKAPCWTHWFACLRSRFQCNAACKSCRLCATTSTLTLFSPSSSCSSSLVIWMWSIWWTLKPYWRYCLPIQVVWILWLYLCINLGAVYLPLCEHLCLVWCNLDQNLYRILHWNFSQLGCEMYHSPVSQVVASSSKSLD